MIKARLLSMQKSSVTKKILLVSFLVIFLFLALPSLGLAQVGVPTGGPANFDLQTPAGFGIGNLDLKTIIGRIVQVFLGLLGTIAVLIIIYGGYVWMTSAGDPRKIDDAKKILRNAIIGLIIILMAFSIVSFILNSLGGNGGGGGPGPVGPPGPPPWGIGGGPIESVYPAPYANEVPINTWIAVTFKEAVDPTTICDTVGPDCVGNNIKNVEICGLENGLCPGSGDFAVAAFVTTKVTNIPGDHRTYVFGPNKYLGYEDLQDRIFQVTLKNAIHKLAAPTISIFEGFLPGQYVWQFTTNGEVDLDPPEIISTNADLNPPGIPNISGVYPDPDSRADAYSASASPTHTGINLSVVGSFTNEVNDSYTQPVGAGTSPTATLTGTYGGPIDATVTVAMTAANQVTTSWPGLPNVVSAYNGGTILDIGPYGLVFTLGGPVVPGNSWTIIVTSHKDGDKIQVLDNTNPVKTYIFGADITPSTLTAAWNKIKTDNATIFEDCSPVVVGCLQTVSTGQASARHGIGFVDQGAVTTLNVAKINGVDATQTRIIRGTPDAYRNAIFQVNFNEAINPLTVALIKVRYDKTVPVFNDLTPDTVATPSLDAPIAPTVSISNQYKTVELAGPIECGVNNCGNKIYCWPTNDLIATDSTDYAHKATLYEIDVPTAKLKTCATDADCQGWGSCQLVASVNRCVKNVGGIDVLLPTADPVMDGIVDMAGNSVNDSFNSYTDNGKVYGQADDKIYPLPATNKPYYLNASLPLYNPSSPAATGLGDNFKWRFWLSDIIDLQSPLIKSIDPSAATAADDGKTDDMLKPIQLVFDRVMRSSTLLPGWGYGSTPKDKSTRYLAIETKTLNINPIGYWINKYNFDDNGDSFPDHTESFINHTLFGLYVRYGTLAGSGLESITQNCLLPGGGPKDAVNILPDSCHYDATGATINCVTDSNLGNSRVKMPNPASYAKLNCNEVTGAVNCPVANNCKSLYVPNIDEGSWIITKDHPAATFPGAAPYKTGCCLGVCKP